MERKDFEYDDHTIFSVKYKSDNDEMDHEFGTEHFTDVKIESICIFVFIRGIDYDVTKAFNDADLQIFKDWSREKLIAEGIV